MSDLGALYGDARRRVRALVTSPAVAGDEPVPATPGWTVHDVVAHLTGVATDAVTGNMAGAPEPEWTAVHISRGADVPIATLVEQWEEYGTQIDALLSTPAGDGYGAIVIDVHTHEADLRSALDLPLDLPPEFVIFVGGLLRDDFHTQVAAAGLSPVLLEADDLCWFRGRLGRRTADEIRALPWSADPEQYLDVFFVFGRALEPLGERA